MLGLELGDCPERAIVLAQQQRWHTMAPMSRRPPPPFRLAVLLAVSLVAFLAATCEAALVSMRGAKIISDQPSAYGKAVSSANADVWATDNPSGWFPLNVAENKLCSSLFLDKMEAVTDYPESIMYYGSMRGLSTVRSAIARVMERNFIKRVNVDSDDLVISAGASGALDNLFWCLANDGEGVLIPAPYYFGFDTDLTYRSHLVPVPVYLPQNGTVADALDAAVANASTMGTPVSAMLITNPNNPTGEIMTEGRLREILAWALSKGIHLVSDEIYAGSIHSNDSGVPFVSIMDVAQQLVDCSSQDPPDDCPKEALAVSNWLDISQELVDGLVHLVYGLSKDWGGSGLRVGVLYTRSPLVKEALSGIQPFGSVSYFSQHALSKVLNDVIWTDTFLNESQTALKSSYDTLTGALRNASIPFISADGGMFVFLDLRCFLEEPTWEAEDLLWNEIVNNCQIVLTPGNFFHATEPGFFRLCFATLPPEAIMEAVSRLGAQLGFAKAKRALNAA